MLLVVYVLGLYLEFCSYLSLFDVSIGCRFVDMLVCWLFDFVLGLFVMWVLFLIVLCF